MSAKKAKLMRRVARIVTVGEKEVDYRTGNERIRRDPKTKAVIGYTRQVFVEEKTTRGMEKKLKAHAKKRGVEATQALMAKMLGEARRAVDAIAQD